MNFTEMHEQLRLEILRRIERGALTGAMLARQTGFRQAHVSNFLRRKRLLSLEGLDRVLLAQKLSAVDLAERDPGAAPAPRPAPAIPLVTHAAAMLEARLARHSILEMVALPESALSHLRPRRAASRKEWARFVAIRVSAQQAAGMEPVLTPGCVAVLDRHYNSLVRYREQHPTLYAIRSGSALLVRYAEFDANRLVLRPYHFSHPVHLTAFAANEMPSDFLVGRVCFVIAEV